MNLHQGLRGDEDIEGLAPFLDRLLFLVESLQTLSIDTLQPKSSGLL